MLARGLSGEYRIMWAYPHYVEAPRELSRRLHCASHDDDLREWVRVMTTAPIPCPGRENHAWREAERKLAEYGTPHEVAPRWGDPVHCEPCVHRARRQLVELPELVAAVWLEAAHGSRGPKVGTIGRIAGGAPAWPGQASRLLTDHIVGGLLELEDDIRQLRGLASRPARGIEGATLTGAVTFLAAHLDWALVHHPAALEAHDRDSANPAAQIGAWHRAAECFTRRDKRLEHHRAPCPRCALLTLFRGDGDDYIECRNPACGTLLTSGEYRDHTRAVAAGVGHEELGLAKIPNAA